MSSKDHIGFLKRHGLDLIEAGYPIVPIKRGDKRPPVHRMGKNTRR